MTQSLGANEFAAPPTANRKIRLAHLQLLPMLSGVQRVTLDLLRALDPAEFDRFLICREPGPLSDAAERAGITCRFAPSLVRPISPWRDLKAYRQLKQLFGEERFDIVHTNSSKPGIVGRLAARAARVPVVVHTVHGFAFPAARSWTTRKLYQTAERMCQPLTDALVCLNDGDRETAQRQLNFSPEQLRIISNGVDIDALRPATASERTDARHRLGCDDHSTLLVGMVGRLWPQKNPLCFVEMADHLVRGGVNARFIMVGDGELRPQVEAEIERRGLRSHVSLLGWRDDVADLLHGLDVFVLPSRWEGLPLVILEAMACGVPVVASDIPGNRAAIEHNGTGLLAELDSATSLAAHVRQLVNDPLLRRDFAHAARAAAEQRFSLQTTISQMRSLYVSLIEKSRRQQGANQERLRVETVVSSRA